MGQFLSTQFDDVANQRSVIPSGEPAHAAGNSSPSRTTWRSRPVLLLVLCGLLLGGIIVAGTGVILSNLRDRALADSERELQNIVLVLAEQTDGAFQAVELVHKSVIERMQSLGVVSGEDYERLMSSHDTHLMLKDKISDLPQVDAVTMINAQGKLINFSRYWPIPAVNVSDRDYFKALKSDPQLTSFLSEPVHNRS